ncbi:hypothetical protein Tco_0011607 [Tanacetum coccineum]
MLFKSTPFYNAFEISTDVLEIYMQEFWVTISRHHSLLCFKLNGKSHTINVDNFRDMLKIFPKLLGQEFEEPPLEYEILSFSKDLGHTGEIKFLSDVNVNHMHQPWRSFAAIINKCLSGKTTALESLHLSRAQILWGIHCRLLPSKGFRPNPRWKTRCFSSYVRDEFMFTTVRVISKHQDTQVYGAILPQHLTNQAMLESEAYMTYRAYATDKPAKKKQYATKSKGLTVLSEVALTEVEQMKIALERSKIQTHSSHASGSGDGDKPEVLDVSEYRLKSEEESWTFSQGGDDEENDEHDSEDDNDEHDSENDNDDEDDDQENEEEKAEEKVNVDDKVSSDQKVLTPPDYELAKEEENQEDDDVMRGEQEDEEDEELYRDLNLNLDRRDDEMTDAQTNQETEEVHMTLTTEPPVVQQQSSSVSSYLFPPYEDHSSRRLPIPQPPIPIIQSQQQTHDSTTTTTIPKTTLPEILNFASLFDRTQNIKAIIKDQVKAQVPKIMPKVKKCVIESLGAELLAKSSNQPQTSYAAAASILEFKLKKILIYKIEENKLMNRSDIQKNLYNTLIESYNSNKDLFASYGDVVNLKTRDVMIKTVTPPNWVAAE